MTKVMFLTNDKSSGQQRHMGIFLWSSKQWHNLIILAQYLLSYIEIINIIVSLSCLM